ncbi:MAG: hypothetical protein ACYS47_21795, partial [Planctomycetota bacterium]
MAVRVPISWLMAADRRYPLTIDPTFASQQTTYGWLNAVGSLINRNGMTGFYGTTSPSNYNSWTNWNITSIPDGSNVSQVELRVNVERVGSATSVAVNVYDFTGSLFGPYTSWNSAVYTDLQNGNMYTTFNATGVAWYPSSSTYYTLS